MPAKTLAAIDRLLPRVRTDGECWRFTGALSSSGYGVIGRGGRGTGTALTHRVTYEFFIGEVPAGLDLDHLCRNRWCCNPWHVEPVTRLVNVARGMRAPGYGPRERSHCPHGHEYSAENTWLRPDGSRRCKACTRRRPSDPVTELEHLR